MLHQISTSSESRPSEESLTVPSASRYLEPVVLGKNFSELDVPPAVRYRQKLTSLPSTRMVCLLLNTGDRPFLEFFLTEARGDTAAAKEILGRMCRGIERVTEESALGLLTALSAHEHSLYRRNLAMAILNAARFAASFEVISSAARIIETEKDCLTQGQCTVLWERAGEYPMSGLQVVRTFSVHNQPLVTEPSRSDSTANDYAGAVATLLCAKIPLPGLTKRRLLEQTVQFAKAFPDGENVWIEVLARHAPSDLQRWKTWLREEVSCFDCARAVVMSMILSPFTTCGLVALAVTMVAVPAGAGLNPAAIVAFGLSIVQISILAGLQLGALLNRYEVDSKQKEQVLRRVGRPEWE
jgi:hypothetical protein